MPISFLSSMAFSSGSWTSLSLSHKEFTCKALSSQITLPKHWILRTRAYLSYANLKQKPQKSVGLKLNEIVMRSELGQLGSASISAVSARDNNFSSKWSKSENPVEPGHFYFCKCFQSITSMDMFNKCIKGNSHQNYTFSLFLPVTACHKTTGNHEISLDLSKTN